MLLTEKWIEQLEGIVGVMDFSQRMNVISVLKSIYRDGYNHCYSEMNGDDEDFNDEVIREEDGDVE